MSCPLPRGEWLLLFLFLQRVLSIEGEHFCWSSPGCCSRPSDPTCWHDGLTFDLCCTRWLHPRLPVAVDVDQMKADLDTCMKTEVFTEADPGCSNSAYSASASIGRLLFCAVEVARVQRVMDVFLGSGCSGATALAAMQSSGGVLVGFEDLDVHHARAARENLRKGLRPHRVVLSGNTSTWLSVRALKAIASRLRQSKSAAWVLSAKLRPNSPGCQDCARFWTVDCPEKCTYQYGVIEAVCEGLQGVDLVFWDSDGSAADGWLPEWLSIERTCAPRFVLLLNLSLPNHGAWIRERLRAFGYREIWWDAKILNPDPYLTMALSDVRRIRSWVLLAFSP